jgi:hypothetical protein
MNYDDEGQDPGVRTLPFGKEQRSSGWLVLFLVALAALVARAQPVDISLKVSGTGTVETPCPRPYQVGQGYVARAIAGAGARFL